ncbi:MAG: hypothetical protein DSZ08_05980 [Sulfurovum sp.]|nr:MAG: hypothetical protein DSZ08_05980 [Sulfurovum sp.]
MKTLKEIISQFVSINETEWKLATKILKIRYYKKGDIICYQDDIWTDFIFINSGLIRSYIINDEGKDFTRQFYFNTPESNIINLFVTDLTSLVTEVPSCRGFEVLIDSEVTVYSKEDLAYLTKLSKKYLQLVKTFMELAYLNTDNDYHNLLTRNNKDRYMHLQKTMPSLLEKVPQYHIATYLGMTPVSLSRIKQKLK